MLPRARRTFAPEEYLLLESQAEYKREHFYGEIFPMVELPPGGIRVKNGIFEQAMAGVS